MLNILGVVLLFFFGFPQPNFEDSVSLGVEENTRFNDGTTVKEIIARTKKKKKFYKIMSYFALSLILIGFIFQLVGVIKK